MEDWPSFYMFEEDAVFRFLFAFMHRMDKRKSYELEELYSYDNGLVYGALYKNGGNTVEIKVECNLVSDRKFREFRYKGKLGGKLRFA